MSRARRLTRPVRHGHDAGASAVEYAIIISLVAVVIVISVAFFGQRVSSLFDRAATCTASPGSPC